MYKRSPILLITLACCLAGGCPFNTTTGGSSGTTIGGGATATATDADQILDFVNQERTSRGLSALTLNSQLTAAAVTHARDMADNGFFSHTGSDGSHVGDRATAAGYSWTAVGENIGQADVSAEEIVDLWMNSPGHRANILGPDFTELGVGTDDGGTKLWVQVFGTP